MTLEAAGLILCGALFGAATSKMVYWLILTVYVLAITLLFRFCGAALQTVGLIVCAGVYGAVAGKMALREQAGGN